MVEMDMSQKNGVEIGNGETKPGKLFPKRGESGGRARVDERGVVLGAQKGSGDRSRMAGPVQVDESGGSHGRTECSAITERCTAKLAAQVSAERKGTGRGRGKTCRMMNLWTMLFLAATCSIRLAQSESLSIRIRPSNGEQAQR